MAHEPHHAVLAARDALLVECLPHPRGAVDAVGAVVDAANPAPQRGIGTESLARYAVCPGVVTASRDTVVTAQKGHAVLVLVMVYEREAVRLRSKLNRMAFFKRSFSIRACFRAASSARIFLCSATVSSMS